MKRGLLDGLGPARGNEPTDVAELSAAFAALLDARAPLAPVDVCPEVSVFQALNLPELGAALDALTGSETGVPYWGLAWPGGAALARVVLDEPSLVRGKRVLDAGAGGGVAAIAAAKAGAAHVIALDLDPWALATTRLAAARNGVEVETLRWDLLEGDPPESAEVILAADMEYSPAAAAIRARLNALAERGATLLVSDCGRDHFQEAGLELLASFERSQLLGSSTRGGSAELCRRHQLAKVTPSRARVFVRRPPEPAPEDDDLDAQEADPPATES